MPYERSNLNYVGAVTAVQYLLHCKMLLCSHNFQYLHFGQHLREIDEEDG